jgi:hypothetical protein
MIASSFGIRIMSAASFHPFPALGGLRDGPLGRNRS